jgi:hypothetical protein
MIARGVKELEGMEKDDEMRKFLRELRGRLRDGWYGM